MRRRPSPLALAVVVAVALGALWLGVAAANGTGPFGHAGTTRIPAFRLPERTPPPPPSNSISMPPIQTRDHDPEQGPAWLWNIVRLLFMAAVLYGVYRLVSRLIRDFRLEKPPTTTAESVDDDQPEVDVQQVAEELRSSLEGLRAGGDFAGTIVACWRRLEDLAAESGAARRPWQSTQEFCLEVLQRTPVERADLEQLADIYRRACYSSAAPGETERREAEDCLQRLSAALEGGEDA